MLVIVVDEFLVLGAIEVNSAIKALAVGSVEAV